MREPRSLALAGAVADGVVLAEPVTAEYLAQTVRTLDAGRAAATDTYGFPALRPPLGGRQVVAYNAAAVAAEPEAARDLVRPALEWIGDPEWADQLAIVGTAASARRRIDQLHAAGATSVVLIPAGPEPENALESLAGVLSEAPREAYAGKPTEGER